MLVPYLISYRADLGMARALALAGACAALVCLIAFAPWERLPQQAQLIVPMAVIVIVALMQVLVLPANFDAEVLLIVPVLWAALYGTSGEVTVVVGTSLAIIVALQCADAATGNPVGLTGWPEVVALGGTMVLLSWFTMQSRAQARIDDLTGLASRRAWDDVLRTEAVPAQNGHEPLTVAMIDLDDFKAYNDAYGHAQGDRHLADCAVAWRATLRDDDILARIGGEEFAVLMKGAGAHGAAAVLERLRAATPNGQTCSVGVAQWDGREGPPDLMDRADQALYAAKEAGRARVVIAPAHAAALADAA